MPFCSPVCGQHWLSGPPAAEGLGMWSLFCSVRGRGNGLGNTVLLLGCSSTGLGGEFGARYAGEASRGPGACRAPPLLRGQDLGCWGIPGASPCCSPGASTPSLVLLSAATEYKHCSFCFFFSFEYIFNYKSRAWLLYSDRGLHTWGGPLGWRPGPSLRLPAPSPQLSAPRSVPGLGEGTQPHCWDRQVSEPMGTILDWIQGHILREGHLPALTSPGGEVSSWPLEKEKQKAPRESKEKARQRVEVESNLAPSPTMRGPGGFPRLPLSAPAPSLPCTQVRPSKGMQGSCPGSAWPQRRGAAITTLCDTRCGGLPLPVLGGRTQCHNPLGLSLGGGWDPPG